MNGVSVANSRRVRRRFVANTLRLPLELLLMLLPLWLHGRWNWSGFELRLWLILLSLLLLHGGRNGSGVKVSHGRSWQRRWRLWVSSVRLHDRNAAAAAATIDRDCWDISGHRNRRSRHGGRQGGRGRGKRRGSGRSYEKRGRGGVGAGGRPGARGALWWRWSWRRWRVLSQVLLVPLLHDPAPVGRPGLQPRGRLRAQIERVRVVHEPRRRLLLLPIPNSGPAAAAVAAALAGSTSGGSTRHSGRQRSRGHGREVRAVIFDAKVAHDHLQRLRIPELFGRHDSIRDIAPIIDCSFQPRPERF
mmetsp:Transcript_75972/g.152639  ORF Transcript_75972/g.152639 Transcript_75972/m.152639 type:complete len:303 (+) Transcript_75972:172-1080(+)